MHHSSLLLADQQGKLKCTPVLWHPKKMAQPKDKMNITGDTQQERD